MNRGLLRLDLGDGRSGQAKYERLKHHLVNEIIAGRLTPGQALPSENHLVKTLGVARMTIRQTMVSLENDGLIRRVQGKGNFVEADARRKLRHGQDIFALIVLETRGGFYPSLLHGFEDAASDIHHQTLICNTHGDVTRQGDIILQLLDKKVGGVAINPTDMPLTPAYQVRQLHERGIPVVFCHRRVEGIAAPLLALPFRDIGRLAGKVLLEHGHRQVAYLSCYRLPTKETCVEGLQEALQAGGCELPVESVYTSDSDVPSVVIKEELVWAALQKMFAKPDRPTAIFTSYDPLAEMIYLLLPRLGLRVPEDVSLIGFGGAWREGALTKRLTSVVVDEIAAGKKAVALLHEMRRGERPIDDNEEIVLRPDLSKGETVAEPKGARELV